MKKIALVLTISCFLVLMGCDGTQPPTKTVVSLSNKELLSLRENSDDWSLKEAMEELKEMKGAPNSTVYAYLRRNHIDYKTLKKNGYFLSDYVGYNESGEENSQWAVKVLLDNYSFYREKTQLSEVFRLILSKDSVGLNKLLEADYMPDLNKSITISTIDGYPFKMSVAELSVAVNDANVLESLVSHGLDFATIDTVVETARVAIDNGNDRVFETVYAHILPEDVVEILRLGVATNHLDYFNKTLGGLSRDAYPKDFFESIFDQLVVFEAFDMFDSFLDRFRALLSARARPGDRSWLDVFLAKVSYGRHARYIFERLIQEGADVNTYDGQGYFQFYTCLMRAIDSTDEYKLRRLLESGASLAGLKQFEGDSPFRYSAYSTIPLIFALDRHNFRAADILVEAGADINMFRPKGANTESAQSLLEMYMKKGDQSVIEYLRSHHAAMHSSES